MKHCASLFATLALFASANAQILNTELLSQLSLGNTNCVRDLWAEGNYVYVAHAGEGVEIVDVSDPQNPFVASNIRPFQGVGNIDIVDVEVHNGVAYLANHVPNGSPTPHVGLFIYNVANPLAPVELGRLEWGAGAWYHLGANLHNLHIHQAGPNTYAYLASRTSNAVEVFDVTNAAAPVWQSTIYPPLSQYGTIPGTVHEITVQGNLCFSTWLTGGFAIHNISNPMAPTLVAYEKYSGAFTYHAWPSTDGQTLFTTDAYSNVGLKSWNISNPSNPLPISSWISGTSAYMHNVIIGGDYVYISHFKDGLRVLDISNPANMAQIAWYDTDPGSSAASGSGAYGAYPHSDGNVYVSHTADQLFAIGITDQVTINSAEWFRNGRNLVVNASSNLSPAPTLTVDGFGPMTYNSFTGDYELTAYSRRKPRRVTVNSDFGGSATKRVKRIR